MFKGSILFASKYAFQRLSKHTIVLLTKNVGSSRRDDIISLLYMLVYLLKGYLPWQTNEELNVQAQYNHVKQYKLELQPDNICTGNASFLTELLTYAYALEFKQKPDYLMIRNCFLRSLDGDQELY